MNPKYVIIQVARLLQPDSPMGSNEGKWGKIMYAMFEHLLAIYGKDVEIIGLKARGNYSHQFWPNRILVLLCEGPEPNISMISGFLGPGESLFINFNIPKILQKMCGEYGNMLGNMFL